MRNSEAWKHDEATGKKETEINRFAIPSLGRARMSFSGHERNHLFMNRTGQAFEDVSGLSGLNSDADGRSFAILDFDMDGWQDIVLANVNDPVISFYRNQFGEIDSSEKNNFVLVDCVGGNLSAKRSSELGCRDGFGAKITVTVNGKNLIREKRSSEGLAAQNSPQLHFGLGSATTANSIEVKWPSGKKISVPNVPSGQLVRFFEDASQSATGSGFEILDAPDLKTEVDARITPEQFRYAPDDGNSANFKMYVSMATWCENCKKHLPEFEFIRQQFEASELAMYGVAVDVTDSQNLLDQYMIENSPAYEIPGWSKSKRSEFAQLIQKRLGTNLLPVTIITDRDGIVLDEFIGVATVSKLSRLGVNRASKGK